MARFLTEIRDLLPRTGRMLKEGGGYINEADYKQQIYDANIGVASLQGRTYRAAARLQDPDVGMHYFAQTVPQGILVKSIAISFSYAGSFDYDLVLRPTAIGNVLDIYPGYNLDARISDPALANIVYVDALTGGDYLPLVFGETPTTGSNRASGFLQSADLRGVYDSDHIAGFALEILSQTTEIDIAWSWEEIPDA